MTRAYEVRIPSISDHVGSEWAETPGKARYKAWLRVSDAWPDLKFTDIKVRLKKKPEPTEDTNMLLRQLEHDGYGRLTR